MGPGDSRRQWWARAALRVAPAVVAALMYLLSGQWGQAAVVAILGAMLALSMRQERLAFKAGFGLGVLVYQRQPDQVALRYRVTGDFTPEPWEFESIYRSVEIKKEGQ